MQILYAWAVEAVPAENLLPASCTTGALRVAAGSVYHTTRILVKLAQRAVAWRGLGEMHVFCGVFV